MDAVECLKQYAEYDHVAKRSLAEYKAESEAIRGLIQIKVFHEPKDYDKKLKVITSYTRNLHVRADEAIRKRDEVMNLINCVPGIEREILIARHVDGLRCEDVADKYCYSLPGMWKVYYRGVAIIQAILDEGKGCSKGYSEK